MSLLKQGWLPLLAAACSGNPTTLVANSAGNDAAASGEQTTTAQTATPTDPSRLNAADRAAIMRAAGYRQVRGEWAKSCDEESRDASYGAEITQLVDLNNDGSPEAVVEGGNTYCYGMTGSAYAVLTRTASGWSVRAEGTGIPGFYPRPGLAWADIEIGGPGSHCFPFERWNGQAYALGGYSVGGEICEEFRPSQIIGLTVGYYASAVRSPDSLDETSVVYVGADRIVDVAGGRFVSLRPAGAGRFIQTEIFPSEEGGPGERQEREIVIQQSDVGFSLDNPRYVYHRVPLDRVPRAARFIDRPEYRNDPRIRPVRGR